MTTATLARRAPEDLPSSVGAAIAAAGCLLAHVCERTATVLRDRPRRGAPIHHDAFHGQDGTHSPDAVRDRILRAHPWARP